MHVHEGLGCFYTCGHASGQTNRVGLKACGNGAAQPRKAGKKTFHKFISTQTFMGVRTCSLPLL